MILLTLLMSRLVLLGLLFLFLYSVTRSAGTQREAARHNAGARLPQRRAAAANPPRYYPPVAARPYRSAPSSRATDETR